MDILRRKAQAAKADEGESPVPNQAARRIEITIERETVSMLLRSHSGALRREHADEQIAFQTPEKK